MKLRNILQALVLALVVIGLVACGGNDNKEEKDTSGDDATASSDAEESDGSSDPVTLKFAAIESAYGSEMWENIVSAFEDSHENVTIDMTIEKNIEEVMRPKMQAGDYPDVFMLATDREEALVETLIKENGVENISDVLTMTVPGEDVTVEDKILDGFTDTLATNPYGDGETYMAPMFYSPTGLFYNKTLLDENGWDVPTTWDEMWELGDKSKEEDIALFTYPIAGYFDTLIGSMLYGSGGPDFFMEAMTYEDGIWESEDATQVFETVEKLADYTHKNTVANANPNDFTKNQQLVLDNEAVFMPNGSWVVGEMEEAPRADGFEWGMTAVPAFEDGGDQYAFTFFEQIWIPKEAENKDAAKEFIAFLYSDEAADIFLEGGAVQPIDGIVEKLDEEQAVYYSVYEDQGALPAMGTFASTEPVAGVNISETLYETVDSVMGDKTDASAWQEAVEKASDELRPAMK